VVVVDVLCSFQNADSILKVIRRLELQKLEQQCWRYLMTAIDPETNVAYLHELADRYDCPPLKLAAWRILKEKIPAMGSFPNGKGHLLRVAKNAATDRILRGTGLTGPGDAAFDNINNVGGIRSVLRLQQIDQAEHMIMPSVFVDYDENPRQRRQNRHAHKQHDNDDDDEDKDDEDEDEEEEEEGEDQVFQELAQRYHEIHLDDLDRHARATDVVLAWSRRLKEVYAQCAPQQQDINDEDLSALKLDEATPNVKLHRFPKQQQHQSNGAQRTVRVTDLGDDLLALDELDDVAAVSTEPPPQPLSSTAKRPYIAQPLDNHSIQRSPLGKTALSLSAAQLSRSAPLSPATGQQQQPNSPVTTHSNKKGAFKAYRSAQAINWNEVLETFYIHMNLQNKIGGIPTIRRTWAGKEDLMLASLLEKYDRDIPDDLYHYLEAVHSLAETQTESSFRRG
jgi:hypothetical protein